MLYEERESNLRMLGRPIWRRRPPHERHVVRQLIESPLSEITEDLSTSGQLLFVLSRDEAVEFLATENRITLGEVTRQRSDSISQCFHAFVSDLRSPSSGSRRLPSLSTGRHVQQPPPGVGISLRISQSPPSPEASPPPRTPYAVR
jgi:hypothetical protein